MEWLPADTLPPLMERPARCFVCFEGFAEHSGVRWHRVHWDLVGTSSDTQWGFSAEDIDRVMRRGDMSVIERIVCWMPAKLPPFPQSH